MMFLSGRNNAIPRSEALKIGTIGLVQIRSKRPYQDVTRLKIALRCSIVFSGDVGTVPQTGAMVCASTFSIPTNARFWLI